MKRILVVEDDPRIGEQVTKLLADEGFEPLLARSIAEARRAMKGADFVLLVLDVNLPDGIGFDLCREVRAEDGRLPVIFLTARLDEDSAVKGLSLGATDYVRKPFAPRELVARLRRALKEVPGPVEIGDLVLDPAEKRISWRGKPLSLTPREHELLAILMQNAGRLVTRETLAERLDTEGTLFDTAIKTYLSRLKAKLRTAGVSGIEIIAVYGSGYRLEKAA